MRRCLLIQTLQCAKCEYIKIDRFFKNDPEYGGCTVMLGIPTFWRDLNKDANKGPHMHKVIKQADMIMPWMVQ